jgi:nicotinamidase-related amidase
MLNPYDHEDADVLAEQAAERIEPVQRLVAATRESGAELIYVNDNYGDFTADSGDLVERALNGERPDLVKPIVPPNGANFIQKVRHSAFYSSSLEYMLREKEVDTLVLAGQVTEQCILYTALDAYVRHFTFRVVKDAVIPIIPELGDAALKMMERNMRAQIVDASDALD